MGSNFLIKKIRIIKTTLALNTILTDGQLRFWIRLQNMLFGIFQCVYLGNFNQSQHKSHTTSLIFLSSFLNVATLIELELMSHYFGVIGTRVVKNLADLRK